jgi:hypothetical protein
MGLTDRVGIGAAVGAGSSLLAMALGRSASTASGVVYATLLGAFQGGLFHGVDACGLGVLKEAAGLRDLRLRPSPGRALLLGAAVGAVNSPHRMLIKMYTNFVQAGAMPDGAAAVATSTSTGTPEGTYHGLWFDVFAVGGAPFLEEMSYRHQLPWGWFVLREAASAQGADALAAFMSDGRALAAAAGLAFGLVHVLNDHADATLQGISTGVLSTPTYMQLYAAGGGGMPGLAACAGAHVFNNALAVLLSHLA